MKFVTSLIAGAILLTGGMSFAHEGEEHGHHHHDAQMAKLHEMMPKYAEAQATINTALEKEDVATVVKETGYLLSTVADLKKSKPHKKLKELADFKKIAGKFEQDVRQTADSARKGDVSGAKAAFAEAQKRCAQCHNKFRD